MALNKTQKEKRDKMVEEISTKLQGKQKQIDINTNAHNDLMVKLQEEKEEMEILKQALESLK